MIWFWLAFVAAASIYGLIKWLYYFSGPARTNFIRRFLKANDIRFLHHRYHHLPLELVQRMIIMKAMTQIHFNTSPKSDNGGQIIGLGVKSPLKQHGAGKGNEILLSPLSGILS